MSEALPNEEPSVLISVWALETLVTLANTFDKDEAQIIDAIEEAQSALERYK